MVYIFNAYLRGISYFKLIFLIGFEFILTQLYLLVFFNVHIIGLHNFFLKILKFLSTSTNFNKLLMFQACTIRFRLPSGKFVTRRFWHSIDTLQSVVDFAGSLGCFQEDYSIIKNHPKENVSGFTL